ncbi:phenylacetic acid degradation B [Natrinema pellirubrum DSM 15624]|uniref:Phenylacetic acid degradation B n=1 Tax=Natrinema pellirubrum (strain DSM 15624 / CIP 106293 / JCM 10476 / NCIMB 786 / 157) TaxID=797303 RepID=L0JPR2_NATP1|nr:Htur_1727 family rSAM-partnered candidate RiPP [Natrinema pellirubrum]AGB32351.1 rSAM-partnered protein, Htur_1727 family [Natrinema pellirubrum DSM 15624]ELY74302.1 phenylacetic acid degradation B [Natrinema pellirubrum DSM 15624]
MVEKARRAPVDSDERGNPTPQWEVFVRNEAGDPMRHVGSVAAASATEAHEHAGRLFGWYAVDLWVCPAESVERFSTRGLAADAEERPDEEANDDDDDGSDEPRVYKETAGASEVNSL